MLPLGFVAAIFAYLYEPRTWIRVAVVLVALPLAIVANACRVAASAASLRLATGDWHALTGIVVFALALPAIPMIRGLLRSVDRRLHA